MKILFSIFVVVLTIYDVTSECCGTYHIEYLPKEGFNCHDIKIPGSRMNNDGTMHELLQMTRGKPPKNMDEIEECLVRVCYDGRWHQGFYCGRGPCNTFGCNCDGGCYRGHEDYPEDPLENFMDNYSDRVEYARIRGEIERWIRSRK